MSKKLFIFSANFRGLKSLLNDAYGRVFEFFRSLDKEEKKLFKDISEQIKAKGFYEISIEDDNKYLDIVLKKAIEADIWFYRLKIVKLRQIQKVFFMHFIK